MNFMPTLLFYDVRIDNSASGNEPVKEFFGVEGGSQIEPRHISLEEARARTGIVSTQRTESLGRKSITISTLSSHTTRVQRLASTEDKVPGEEKFGAQAT